MSGYEIRSTRQSIATGNPPAVVNTSVSCPAGKRAIGGGFVVGDNGMVEPIASFPSTFDSRQWLVRVRTLTSAPQEVDVYVICAAS